MDGRGSGIHETLPIEKGALEMDQKPEGATKIFVFGLIGLLVCPILGVVVWVLGNIYLTQCRQMNVQPEGIAVAGRILGIIATVFWILGTIITLFILPFTGGGFSQ